MMIIFLPNRGDVCGPVFVFSSFQPTVSYCMQVCRLTKWQNIL